ncbi:hypothetical protein [Desulfuromonas sp. AOP6]|uniref:hypothetical protein n=1 Tax=Desulfuromonas sp. AOP6 TaxID=1566351 RepID=UPI0012DD798F|nr:hypothetical protein [Desulfuromonas sp. AOP6]
MAPQTEKGVFFLATQIQNTVLLLPMNGQFIRRNGFLASKKPTGSPPPKGAITGADPICLETGRL